MSIPPDMDMTQITGPRFMAHLLNWGLYGVSMMQTYVYFTQFPDDSVQIKSLVYSTFTIETVQTVLLTYSGFMDFVHGFGDYAELNKIKIGFVSLCVTTGLVAFAAQCFYAYRINLLSGSRAIACFIALLSIIQLAGSIATTVVIAKAKLFTNAIGTASKVTATIWEGGSALCDVVIAGCMIYCLRTRDRNMHTKVILTNLIRLIVGTGALTATFSVLCLVMGYLPSKPTYYQPTTIVLGKMYFNSIMVLLNARTALQRSRPTINNLDNDDTIRFAKSTVVTVELQERARANTSAEVSHLDLGKEGSTPGSKFFRV